MRGGENMYDYSKLLAKIYSKFHSKFEFAMEMEMTMQTLINKLKNRNPWNQRQIEKCCDILDIDRSEIVDYFFTKQIT